VHIQAFQMFWSKKSKLTNTQDLRMSGPSSTSNLFLIWVTCSCHWWKTTEGPPDYAMTRWRNGILIRRGEHSKTRLNVLKARMCAKIGDYLLETHGESHRDGFFGIRHLLVPLD
jgi:hypothetical protein